MKRSSKKGFTLAELLIVIAIIAILVAIMVPVFGAQLTKARAAAELANVRAAYSEAVADAMLGDPNAHDLTKKPTADGKVSIKWSDLDAACQYPSETLVDVVTSTTAPTSKGTKDLQDSSVADGTTVRYIQVTYGDYFGSFKIDEDVTIEAPGSTEGGGAG